MIHARALTLSFRSKLETGISFQNCKQTKTQYLDEIQTPKLSGRAVLCIMQGSGNTQKQENHRRSTQKKFTMYVHWTLDNVQRTFMLQISSDVIDWSNYFFSATPPSKMC